MNQTMNQSEKSNDATQIARGHIEAVRAGSAGTYRYTMNVNGLMQELGFRVPDCIVAHEEEQARKKGGYEPPPAGFGV